MKYVHDTWYRLADGTQADPNDVAPDKDGKLRHKNGVPVAMRADGNPQTLGVATVENKNVEAANAGKEAAAKAARDQTAPRAPAAQGAAAMPADDAVPRRLTASPSRARGGRYKNRELKSA